MPVNTPNSTYDALTDVWEKCRDTARGEDVIKAKGQKYLPPLDSHLKEGGQTKYDAYKKRGVYYNAVGRTIVGLGGAVFQKAPAISADTEVTKHVKDITLTSEPLDMFSLHVTTEYLTLGRIGILVDMAFEGKEENRPYWVAYTAEEIINWTFTKIDGDQKLTMVVLKESFDIPDEKDEFKCAQDIRYRVLRLTKLSGGMVYSQQLYTPKKSESGAVQSMKEYEPGPLVVPTRRGVPLPFIPFALPWSVNTPPLLDLVNLNLAHYRMSVDHKHGLHFTAMPTPWVAGATDTNSPLTIGGGTAWVLEKEGRAGMLEFTGAGLQAIRQDLQDMQANMATLGARLLEPPPRYSETATSVSMRHSSDYATLKSIAQVLEQQISYALKIHAWWVNPKIKKAEEDESNIELNKVFYEQAVSADELRALLLALQSATISYKTFYARLQNTGWTREGIDYEQELKDIKDQPPDVGVSPQMKDKEILKEGDAAPQTGQKGAQPVVK
jgi:hypothetical protein